MSTAAVVSLDRSEEGYTDRSSEFISSPLPEWIWSDVERLYQSVFSSRVMLEKPELIGTILYAWVEKNEQQITDILLFRNDGCTTRVANEVIAFSSGVIERFSNAVFLNYPIIQFIRLHSIKLQSELKKIAAFKSEFSEDYVLTLPASKERWVASLSSRTRERLRMYVRQAKDTKNSISLSISQRGEIDESEVRYLLKLNQDRMQQKGKSYGISALEEDRICRELKIVGYLFLLKKKDQICAGLLCSVVGNDIYMHVLAHDTKYDALRLGWVCCYQAVEHLISENFQRIHFLWGHYDYKKKMGAKPIELYRVLIVRSLTKSLLHPKILMQWIFEACRDRARKHRHRLVVYRMNSR
jgi:hypothetical protein